MIKTCQGVLSEMKRLSLFSLLFTFLFTSLSISSSTTPEHKNSPFTANVMACLVVTERRRWLRDHWTITLDLAVEIRPVRIYQFFPNFNFHFLLHFLLFYTHFLWFSKRFSKRSHESVSCARKSLQFLI